MDYSVLIGGKAGQGIGTTASLLAKILKRNGFYVFSNSDYMSRIRGGHNFIQIRFSNKPIYSHNSKVDIIFALNEETIEIYKSDLKNSGVIIADKEISIREKEVKDKVLPLPLMETAKQLKNLKVFPTVGLGAILMYFNRYFTALCCLEQSQHFRLV